MSNLNFSLDSPQLPRQEILDRRYAVRFATTEEEVIQALRLRFEVFNLELKEGLDSSYSLGRDQDEFDAHCHHLIVEDRETRKTIGTYRMQTAAMASRGRGFYSDGEYDLSILPQTILSHSMEVGRACIARQHRNTKVLFLLWRGLAVYMEHNHLRYLFGCCSITSQDPLEGLRHARYLRQAGHMHPEILIPARPDFSCEGSLPDDDECRDIALPPLFRIYLKHGSQVCSQPAIDRQFKTIDFLVLLDVLRLPERNRDMFFA